MATDPKDLFESLKTSDKLRISEPDKSLDALVQEIFDQTKKQRDWLLRFYMWYTSLLSGLVMGLIIFQAGVRFFTYGNQEIELIPQWALNLIVVGMFGQFIGLLTIVTKKVWDFGSFFEYTKEKIPKK